MGNENGEWIMHGLAYDDPARIRTPEELLALVERIGFLPLFRGEIPGFSVEEHTLAGDWWSGDTSRDPWEWRILLARSGKVAYGKFFGGRAGFLSLEWLPVFANARRDGYDFDARWDDGKTTYRCKRIMDVMEGAEPCFSYQLRERAGFGKGGEKNFEGTVTRLQMETYLVVRDFRQKLNRRMEPYGWHIALYQTPEEVWGREKVCACYGEAPAVSARKIRARVQELFPNAPEKAVREIAEG